MWGMLKYKIILSFRYRKREWPHCYKCQCQHYVVAGDNFAKINYAYIYVFRTFISLFCNISGCESLNHYRKRVLLVAKLNSFGNCLSTLSLSPHTVCNIVLQFVFYLNSSFVFELMYEKNIQLWSPFCC